MAHADPLDIVKVETQAGPSETTSDGDKLPESLRTDLHGESDTDFEYPPGLMLDSASR